MVYQADSCVVKYTRRGFRDFAAGVYEDDLRYCREDGNLYAYIDGIWVQNRGDYVDAMIEELIEALEGGESEYAGRQESADIYLKWYKSLDSASVVPWTIRTLKASKRLAIRKAKFDSGLALLNLRNGTYDLENDRFMLHRRSQFHTRMAPVDYAPNADCPEFRKMLSDTFDGDTGTMQYVQRVLGYCLCGETHEKRCWIFHSRDPHCGKTTLLKVMEAVLGTAAGGYSGKMRKQAIKAKGDAMNAGLAALNYKPRFVMVDELPKGCELSDEIIKEVTSGGTGIMANNPGKSAEHIDVNFKLVIATNHLPSLNSFDPSIIDRITVVPFRHVFPVTGGLESRWKMEISGILNWLIEGYRLWKLDPLFNVPPAVEAATAEIDSLGVFLKEFTDDPSSNVRVGDLHLLHTKWCVDSNRPHAVIMKNMTTPLRNKGYRVDEKSNVGGANGRPVVFGLKLK